MRDYNNEAKDNQKRKYNYNIDIIYRELMLNDFHPYINGNIEAKTLEVGSYDGSMTSQILNYVPHVYVAEPSEEMARIVKNKFGTKVNVDVNTVENIDFDFEFDNIFLIHTLEHVDNPIEILMKLKKIKKPSGRIFIGVPNGNALSRQIGVHMNLIPSNASVLQSEAAQGHLRTYQIDTLRHDLINAGLEIEVLTGVFIKALANFQIDFALKEGIIDDNYISACNALAKIYPDFSASIIAICK